MYWVEVQSSVLGFPDWLGSLVALYVVSSVLWGLIYAEVGLVGPCVAETKLSSSTESLGLRWIKVLVREEQEGVGWGLMLSSLWDGSPSACLLTIVFSGGVYVALVCRGRQLLRKCAF